MIYGGGTYCGAAGKSRETQIEFSCGDELKVISMTEPSTCSYQIKVTKPCDCSKEIRPVNKMNRMIIKTEGYINLWYGDHPRFMARMVQRWTIVGEKLIEFYINAGLDIDAVIQADDEVDRFNSYYDHSKLLVLFCSISTDT
jgi:hypothetical protein